MSPYRKFDTASLQKRTLFSLSELLFTQITGGIYLFSLKLRKLLYHNEEFENLTGLSAAELKKKGLTTFLELVAPPDLEMIMNTAYPFITDVLHKKEGSEFSVYKYSLNYRIRTHSGRVKHLFHQTTVLQHEHNNAPDITLAHISDITEYNKDAAIVLRISAFDASKKKWKKLAEERFLHRPVHLSVRETDVMQLIITGQSHHDIARKLHISYYTVRAHCRHILEKTSCRSIVDLKQKCKNEGWA